MTKYRKALRCKSGRHVWSWNLTVTPGDDKTPTMMRHLCKNCGAASEAVPYNQRVVWRCLNGLLDMKDFFPEVAELQRVNFRLKLSSICSVLAAVGALLSGNYSLVGVFLFVLLANEVTRQAVRWEAQQLLLQESKVLELHPHHLKRKT